jgi:hypothetical protein
VDAASTGLWHALALAAGMLWQVLWSLILGFVLSAVVQAVVSKDEMRSVLGGDGPRQIAIATGFGAASSSCSYAAAAMSKTLFKKGAGLIPSLAFLFSSTNLVIELGLVLVVLMGWQFAAAEWAGGLVLIVLMSLLVYATYPARLVDEARSFRSAAGGHDHGSAEIEGRSIGAKLRDPGARAAIAANFTMDVSMLWKDLLAGFAIAGALAAFVPVSVWSGLFAPEATGVSHALQNAIVGPLVAIFTFVCSIGNVPMAAILWSSGMSFGGVLAFLYADLIVLPLLDAYRRYYGWKMAAYIFAVFIVTMVAAALIVDAAFNALGLVPMHRDVRVTLPSFAIDATFWLNLGFGAVAVWLWLIDRNAPAAHHCGHEPGGVAHDHA